MVQTNESPPERVGPGIGLSLTEGVSRLFGRSLFQQQALMFASVASLVVAGVEFGLAALFLLLFAYRSRLLGRKNAPRLRFTTRVLAVLAATGSFNILGRGLSTFALDTGMSIALFDAVALAVPMLVFPYEMWGRSKTTALALPVLMCVGLAGAAQFWDASVSLTGLTWALVGGLFGLLSLPMSRFVIDMEREAADQFQALSILIGALGLLAWAWLAGDALTDGWSWDLFGVLTVSAVLSVVLPRHFHVLARRAVSDGLYAVFSVLSLLIAVGVDYLMVGTLPGKWQAMGLAVVGLVAFSAGYLKWRDQRSRAAPEPEKT